jgi:hypothetical protein
VLARADLEGPVRSVLGDPGAQVEEWRSEPVAYDFLNPSSGGVYRVAGTACGRAWRLVLKVTQAPQGVAPELAEVLREAVRWDRELHAYESGFLGRLDGGIVAAACHGSARRGDATGWLWLEDLGGAPAPSSLVDWSRVASALGGFNGGFLGRGAVPDEPWLGRRWLRVWVTQVTPQSFWEPSRVPAEHPLRERLLALWAARETLLAAVEALQPTCCHLDAHHRNLFLREDDVVAIDWGVVGLAPPGEELASTLVGTVASGEFPAEDVRELAEALYDPYLEGLRAAGWRGDQRDVRLAFAAAGGRRVFAVLAGPAPLAAFLLDLGEEAMSLVGEKRLRVR